MGCGDQKAKATRLAVNLYRAIKKEGEFLLS